MSTRSGPETRLVQKLIAEIKRRGGHARKTRGDQFTAGEPDIDACLTGRAVKIEVKVPASEGGKVPTPLQMATLRTWERAGALAGWVTSLDELDALLSHLSDTAWLNPQLAR